MPTTTYTCGKCHGTGRYVRTEKCDACYQGTYMQKVPIDFGGYHTVEVKCGKCHGTVEIKNYDCPDCNGTGKWNEYIESPPRLQTPPREQSLPKSRLCAKCKKKFTPHISSQGAYYNQQSYCSAVCSPPIGCKECGLALEKVPGALCKGFNCTRNREDANKRQRKNRYINNKKSEYASFCIIFVQIIFQIIPITLLLLCVITGVIIAITSFTINGVIACTIIGGIALIWTIIGLCLTSTNNIYRVFIDKFVDICYSNVTDDQIPLNIPYGETINCDKYKICKCWGESDTIQLSADGFYFDKPSRHNCCQEFTHSQFVIGFCCSKDKICCVIMILIAIVFVIVPLFTVIILINNQNALMMDFIDALEDDYGLSYDLTKNILIIASMVLGAIIFIALGVIACIGKSICCSDSRNVIISF